jgi:flagellar biosynthesis protein FlhA
VAAGFLVSKSSTEGSTGTQVFREFGAYPMAMFASAGLLFILSLIPGMPLLPFWLLAGALAGMGYLTVEGSKIAAKQAEIEEAKKAEQAPAAPTEEPIASILHIDVLRLELGYGLLNLIDESKGGRLTEQIKAMRRQMAKEIGFVVPSIRIQDNMQLEPGAYIISIKDIQVGKGTLRPGKLMAMDPTGSAPPMPGEATTEPTFGLPAKWIDEARREEASFNGYTVVDSSTIIVTHLTEVIKDNLAELLTRNETQKLLDEIKGQHDKLISELIPSQINMAVLQKVLQNLLAERISIRDLPTILEAISDAVTTTKNISIITEMVRVRLNRQISSAYANDQGIIPIVSLSGGWEKEFSTSILTTGDDRQLAMEPSKVQAFIKATRDTVEQQMMSGVQPVLLTSPANRPFVRSLLERTLPTVPVISQAEIHPKAKIRTVGTI